MTLGIDPIKFQKQMMEGMEQTLKKEEVKRYIHPMMRFMIGEEVCDILERHKIGEDGKLKFGFGFKDGEDTVRFESSTMNDECIFELSAYFKKTVKWEPIT